MLLIPLSRVAFGAPKWGPKMRQTKAKFAKNDISPKKKKRFYFTKKARMVRFIFKPAYSHVAGARELFFEFSLPVSSFFSRHLPAPFRSDGNGEVVFFIISKTRFSAETRAPRACVDAAAVTHFCEICAGGMARFRLCARAIKTDRLKGIHF